MKILIIDDELQTLRNVVDTLENLGCQVDTVLPFEGFNLLISEKSKFKYDIVFIDYNFERGVFPNEESANKLRNGEELCKELQNYNLFTPLVLHTIIGDNFHVARKVLGDYGISYFYSKQEFKGDIKMNLHHLTTLPSFKHIWTIRQFEIRNDLKIFFKNISNYKIVEFLKEAKKGNEANWNSDKLVVKIHGSEYLLSELFRRFSIEEISKEVIDLLSFYRYDYEFKRYHFQGQFKLYEVFFSHYWSLNEQKRSEIKAQIDRQSLDYLLNLVWIYNEIQKKSKDCFFKKCYLNSRNQKLKVSGKCAGQYDFKKKELFVDEKSKDWKQFRDKLIGRRIILGYYENIGLEGDIENDDLATILKFGYLEENTKAASSIFSTQLGLTGNFSYKNGIEMSEYYILYEEMNWLETHGKCIVELRKYLDEFDTKFQLHTNKQIIDLTELQEVIIDYRKKVSNTVFQSFYDEQKKVFNVYKVNTIKLIEACFNTQ